MPRMLLCALTAACGAVALFLTTSAGAQENPPSETVVQPAADAIFAAFERHPLVGIGDDHGLGAAMDFYEALARDPRFAREVGNLVVEFGAGGRQDVVDRYVAGETVPYAELRTVWSDAIGWTPVPAWLGFARLLLAVRQVNSDLPPERHIRIWLGEPPVDWSAATRDDIIAAINARDSHPAELIKREILAKGGKAVVIYGGFHFGGGNWLRGRVEAHRPGAFYTVLGAYGIERMRPGVCAGLRSRAAESRPAPAIAAPARDGEPDAALRDCATLQPAAQGRGFVVSSGGAGGAPAPNQTALTNLLRTQGDGVLFLGPSEHLGYGAFLPDYLFEPDYRREMARRAALGGPGLSGFPPGFRFVKADYAIDLEAPGFAEMVERTFAANDRNRDGTITFEEYVDPLR
jgi:hypothetical protein